MRQLSVIVPTYREAENLSVLIPRLTRIFSDNDIDGEIIVVDDNSPDHTVEVINELALQHPARLIVRTTERGLSSAVIAGMRAATGEVLLCMDADLSHPPEDVPKLFAPISGGNTDFVIGSRYVAGGSTESGWGFGRWLNSKAATILAWPLTTTSDPMAGFFALRRSDFERCNSQLDPIGYKIGLELLVKTRPLHISEVPISFRNRLHGESKLSLREQLNYLTHLGRLYRFRFPRLSRFMTFGVVGACGVLVDLLIFLLLLRAGVSSGVATALAIWGAMTCNFEWNRRITFSDRSRRWHRAYLAFCLSCLVGAGVNAGVRLSLMSSFSWFSQNAWGAALAGIVSGLVFNFSLCELFVFRRASELRTSGIGESALKQQPNIPDELVSSVPASGTAYGWVFRVLLLLAVIASAVWARGLLSQTRQTTLKSVKRAQSMVVAQADQDGSKSKTEQPRQIPNVVTVSSTKLELRPHRGFEFSDIDIEERLRTDARYLASDELEGRGTQTAGIDKAAEYLAREFAKAGLNTNATGKGAFHEFPLLTRESQASVSQVTLQDSAAVLHAVARGRDFSSVLVPKPKQVSGEIAFVGFGISAPEWDYDEFADLEMRGRVLVMLRTEPTHGDWQSHAATKDGTSHALLRTKIRLAISRGAAAVVLCDPKSGIQGNTEDAELLSIDLSPEFPGTLLPVIHVRREVLRRLLLTTAKFDLDQAEAEIQRTLKPQSQVFKNVSMSLRVERPKVSQTLKNVVGTLDGRGSQTSETIVIGAHYDHLGYGGWGSLELTGRREIHNGADDNASGTVVMLEVARQLASLHQQRPLARRICFIAFSAEELGLIGSKKYTSEPWFPIESTIAMLNLDMVGRLRNDDLTIYGVGTSPIWTPLLRPLAKQYQLNLQLREGGYGPSDHASFYERGVPVLHFFTGFHAEYHRPHDDSGLLNYRGMRTLSHVVSELALALSELGERPSRSTPQLELAELESPTALGEVVGARLPPAKFQLGVQMSPSEQGVVVRGTLPHSLAERSGFRAGDVIQSINGQNVATPAEAISQIQKHLRPAPLIVQVDRNGLRLKFSVEE